ncbi:MAG: hypothetical protein I3273_04135 [Candidatus Moeniiplasma glomeromycotorum]|nr:hypothetical protein [Candidatus Moeniiplasma glomeromycotorum]
MVKTANKTIINENNPLNSQNQTLKLDNKLSKKRNRKEYSAQRYQAKKKYYRERYLKRKMEKEKQEREQLSKYYGVEAIKILMSFKEYTELNKEKKQLWLDFNWTLQDCQKSFKEGFADIVFVMKLEEAAHKLNTDYWHTAKNEIKKGKSWNSLTDQEKQKLIRYWGQEKFRWEKGLIENLEQQQSQGKKFEKELEKQIELSKFHEERGKIKCQCWSCQEIKEKTTAMDKFYKADEEKQSKERVECSNCGRKVKELDEENDICRKCIESYG